MGKNKEISNGLKMIKYRMVKKEEISNGFEKLTILGKNVPIPITDNQTRVIGSSFLLDSYRIVKRY